MRDVRYRTTVRVECPVQDGDDVAALDEARDAVRAAMSRSGARNTANDPIVVRWECTDDGVVFYAELSTRTDHHPPTTVRDGDMQPDRPVRANRIPADDVQGGNDAVHA